LTGRLLDTAARAVLLDKFDAEAHTILAMACNWNREIDRALLEDERAVELNPNSAAAHAIKDTCSCSSAGRSKRFPVLSELYLFLLETRATVFGCQWSD